MAYTLTYELINNETEYSVTGYTGEPVDVVIPEEYNGLPVTSIGYGVFEFCNIKSIIIPDSITIIGGNAFSYCDSLTSVTIGNGVTSISWGAFECCHSLTSIVLPASVTSIGDGAFGSCTNLTSINIPDRVTSIGARAFLNCVSLTSIIIPVSVVSIGENAFNYDGDYGFGTLTSVVLLPNTPPTLQESAFLTLKNTKFYCLSSAIDSYKTATNWNTYANQFIADDMRLYFTMNSRAQKKYFATKEAVATVTENLENRLSNINIYYSNSTPTIQNLGGIVAGTTFENVSIGDLLTNLLYPYIPPEIKSVILVPSADVCYKKGTTFNVTQAKTTIVRNSKAISEVHLIQDSTGLMYISEPDITSEGTTVTFDVPSNLTSIDSDTTFTVAVHEKDSDPQTYVSKSVSYTFVDPYYCGVIDANTDITASLILGLTEKIEAKETKNYSYTTTSNQCAVIAYPASYGELKEIKDPNNFTQIWDMYEVTINEVAYYVYVSTAAAAENCTYKFSY